MIAGTLEIQMLANMARLQADMTQAKGMVGGAMKSIEGAVASAKSALGALGIGLGVGYFVTLIKGSIDAMDHLNDLSKSTSIAVEQLAGLRLASKQSGGDLDSIAASINKLSVNMGKDAERFAALGISAKDPLEAFKQLSDLFVSIKDPQQRAAVAAEALGKSWAGAAPLLAEGGKRIGEMVDRGTRLTGVTKEMAEQADSFNDKWMELTGTGGLFIRLVGPMLPILTALADEMLKVGDNAVKADTGFKPLLETLRALVILGGEFSFVWRHIGISLAGVGAQFDAFRNGGMKALMETREMMKGILAEDRKLHDAWVARMMAAGTPGSPTPGGTKKPATVSTAGVAGFIDNGKAANEALKEAERYRKMNLDGWLKTVDAMTEADDQYYKDQAKFAEDASKELERLRKIDTDNWLKTVDAMTEADDQYYTDRAKQADKTAKEASEAWKTAAKDMQRGMSSFFFDVMQGNLSDLGGSFKRTIDKMVADVLAAKAATALFGDEFMNGKGGSSVGGWIGTAMSAFGLSGGGGGPELLNSFATGTDYVPQTGMYQLHQGEAVVPAAENNGGRGMTVTNVFHISGPMDKRSQAQIAVAAGEGVQRAMARNT